MQARVFSRREIQADFVLTLQHHAVGADIQITRVRVPRNDRVSGSGVPPAVQWPVFGYRQLIQIDFIVGETIRVKASLR